MSKQVIIIPTQEELCAILRAQRAQYADLVDSDNDDYDDTDEDEGYGCNPPDVDGELERILDLYFG